MHRVLGVAVAEVILDEPEVVALVRQVETAGVPQRVRVNPFEASSLGGHIHHVVDRLAGQWLREFTEDVPEAFFPCSDEVEELMHKSKGKGRLATAMNSGAPCFTVFCSPNPSEAGSCLYGHVLQSYMNIVMTMLGMDMLLVSSQGSRTQPASQESHPQE